MPTIALEEPMKRNDVTFKIDRDVLKECRLAADFLDLQLAEYISLRMKEAAARDIEAGIAKRAAAAKGGPKPKGKG